MEKEIQLVDKKKEESKKPDPKPQQVAEVKKEDKKVDNAVDKAMKKLDSNDKKKAQPEVKKAQINANPLGLNAYEYDENGNPTVQANAEVDSQKVEKIAAQPEKELSLQEIYAKLKEVENMRKKIDKAAGQEPKESDLSKQVNGAWNAQDEKEMDQIAASYAKKSENAISSAEVKSEIAKRQQEEEKKQKKEQHEQKKQEKQDKTHLLMDSMQQNNLEL